MLARQRAHAASHAIVQPPAERARSQESPTRKHECDLKGMRTKEYAKADTNPPRPHLLPEGSLWPEFAIGKISGTLPGLRWKNHHVRLSGGRFRASVASLRIPLLIFKYPNRPDHNPGE